MRIDLTVRDEEANERDVAVIAPPGTRWAELGALLEGDVGGQPHVDRGALRPEDVLGRAPLVSGAVLRRSASPRPAAAGGTRLEVHTGCDAGTGVVLGRGAVTVGRGRGCELRLRDPRVSRRHARIVSTGAGSEVYDLGSAHGTWLDGRRVGSAQPLTRSSLLRIGDTFLGLSLHDQPALPLPEGPDGTFVVAGGQAPATHRHAPPRRLAFPAEPQDRPAPRVPWIAALVPAAAAGALAAVLQSVHLLLFAALAPLTLVAAATGERVHWRRCRRRAHATLRRDVARVEAELEATLAREAAERRRDDPSPAALLGHVTAPTSRLWERRRGDDGLLRVRVGLADRASVTEAVRAGAAAPAGTVPSVPYVVDLAAGAVGITAPRPVAEALARWIVAQLAALAPPSAVEFALLIDDERAWHWMRWLPQFRGRVAATPHGRLGLAADLAALVAARRRGAVATAASSGPALVVLVDLHGAPPPPGLAAIAADGAAVGVTALCLAERGHHLPVRCPQVVGALDDTGSRVLVSVTEVIADRVPPRWADRLARALAPLRDAAADAETVLPDSCRLLELLDLDPPHRAEIGRRWLTSGGRPDVTIGVTATGPLQIDLERDGPHALVGGTTGAGKSELLQTLIAGLAVAHPPDEITFLLIDYKGGATFAPYAELPHVVGLVTDLDDSLAQRMLRALESEVRRRERMLATAGARDLAAYRTGGRRDLPRLVVLVDEFATLAEECAGLLPGLLDVAQRGRSLGLHLVLATQRPAGAVSADIRANTTLRVALRTTSVADSLDVIDSADAAAVAPGSPGRGFIRCGGVTAAFQAAAVTSVPPAHAAGSVRVVPLGGWRRLPQCDGAPGRAPGGCEPDLAFLIREVRAAAAGRAAPRRPWLPPLPSALSECELPVTSRREAAIGLVDLVDEQSRLPLTIDLTSGGGVLLVGGPGSGRSTALRSIGHAAASRCSPRDLEVHAVGLGGSQLSGLGRLPHAGTVVGRADAAELLPRLFERLHEQFLHRQEHRLAGRDVPGLLLLVDGWEELLRLSEERDAGRTAERLLALMALAGAAAATVVVAGGRAALAPRVTGAARTRLALELPDPADYAQLGLAPADVGRLATPGRGFRCPDGAQFQLAVIGPPEVPGGVAPGRALRLRALPRRIRLAEIRAATTGAEHEGQPRTEGADGRCLLAVGGDRAQPLGVDLAAGAGRLLIAGPPRSGRSTALRCALAHYAPRRPVVAAPTRSPLAVAARAHGLQVLAPDHEAASDDRGDAERLGAASVILVDDVECFADTAVGDALLHWLRRDRMGRIAVIAGRAEALAVDFRGPAAELRRARCGLLLQPGPADGDLLGMALPRQRCDPIPGRGVLVPEPAWGLGGAPLPVQVALPE